MLISLITYFKLAKVNKLMGMIVITFGFLISGFALLVSHINQMDPQITHMMPVLNSPLLSIHVCIIMMSFALLSLTFICSIIGLLFRKIEKQLAVLSMIFLYPALTTLGIGIFTGAIWANISWGQYWSWDPKETWALITFMVYAIAVHNKTLSRLNNPRFYHTYMLIAFVTLLMTYFGVNYVLGGMHSYA
jgi:ABC-type transport system involved in cytochrome c biogenesis permease subunit